MCPTSIFWLERSADELPVHREWLSDAESKRLQEFRFLRRRDDWLLGRWAAKHAISLFLELPATTPGLREIEVIPAESGAPEAYVSGMAAAASISITHRGNKAVCAITRPEVSVGCDLEIVEPRSDDFVCDYFSPEEIKIIEKCHEEDVRQGAINLIWSAKESALKAQHVGLRADTRSVVVNLEDVEKVSDDEWRRLRVVGDNTETWDGWWKRSGAWVITVVATQPSRPPISLQVQHSNVSVT